MTDGPLAGVRVIEICQNVAGPFATSILGQLGADVVKVERPGVGDDTRQWGPPFWNEESVMFGVMNAGKRSVGIDIDDPAGRERLREMALASDVVVSSMRPGSLERRGLGPEDLRGQEPRLIYASLSGFGAGGPLSDAPAYDPLIQAFAGMMSLTGHPGQPPVRVGTSMMDMGAGMWLALGTLAALRRRDETGAGAHVTTSLFEAGLGWIPYQLSGYLATGTVPGKLGSAIAMLAPYQAFETSDGHVVVAVGNDLQWQNFCEVIERPDLAADPELATNPGRVAQRARLAEELTKTLRTRSAANWEERLLAVGIPCRQLQTLDEVVEHPQTQALGMLQQIDHPDAEGFTAVALPFRLDGERPGPGGPPPPLPEDPGVRGGAATAFGDVDGSTSSPP